MFSFLFDAINISLIITALLNLSLGVLIFISGKNKKINIVYSLNIAAIISWVMAMFFYRSSPPETNLFWCTVLYVTPTLIASSFLYFTYIFPSQKEKRIWWRAILIFGINLAIIVMVVWPGLIIKAVNIRPGLEKQIIFTPYYWFYFIYTLQFFSFGFFRLFKKYFINRGIERLQIIYLVTGYSLAANLAFGTNLIMPWIGYFFLNWLGQVFTCIMVAFTTYAILKYRLMDIRIVIRKVFVYFGMAGLVYGMFYLIAWLYSVYLGDVFAHLGYILGLIFAPLFVLLFIWLNEKIKGVANKYLFFSLYSSQEAVARLTDELTNSIDLKKVVASIVDNIKDAMQLDRAGILIIDQNNGTTKYKIAKVVGFNEGNGISLVQDNFLTQYLQKTQKPLVRDELQMIAKDLISAEEKQSFNQLAENMKHIEASLCLPMIISNKLIGIVVLGSKISGDAYTSEDLTLLSTLSKQAAIAVDNARLYMEVQDFNKTLQQKVDEQTKEIKKAYEVEKQARQELEKTDEVKNQFLAIVNHHLRTPLTAISWYTDLLFSGKYGKISAKSKDILSKIKDSVSDGIKIVNDLLDVSQFQMGVDIVSQKSKVDLKNILSGIIKNVTPEAEQKGIKINLKSEKGVPKIIADESKLKVVLANILDNAVKYTDKGEIFVSLKNNGENIQIEVKDSGMGMLEAEIKNLFVKTFERSASARQANVVGRGIGLYVSSKIIEAHNGKIWAKSEGKGKGSTFIVELPVAGK